MRKISLLFAIILISLSSMQAQWKQTKTGQTSLISEISVIDNNTIWAMDQLHTSVSYTLNGGVSWITNALPTTLTGYSSGNLCAVNATTAYLIGCSGAANGIYKTTDNGINWTLQPTGFTSTSLFPDLVHFWNENDGVAIGDAGTDGKFEIYYTSNGGIQWNLVPTATLPASGANDATYNVSTAYRVLNNTFFVKTNYGKILKSTDKGITWTLLNTPATSLNFSFDFKDENNGLLISTNGFINFCYTTTDGGANWTSNPTPPFNGNVKYFAATKSYMATGPNGLAYTTDGGQTWTNNTSFSKVGLGDIKFSATNRVFASGWSNLFYSDSYTTENISIKSVQIVNTNAFDIAYSQQPGISTACDTSNYNINSIHYKATTKLKINSITQDAVDKSIVHLVLNNNLPQDSITMYVKNITDNNGINANSMLYNEPGIYFLFRYYDTNKSVNVATPGTLLSLLNANDKRLSTKLTVTGTIDARDFRIIRDTLQGITELDLSGASIAAYTGTEGTYSSAASYVYAQNSTPQRAFFNASTTLGMARLTAIKLPTTLTTLGMSTFARCTGLTSVTIPATVTSIGQSAFSGCTAINSLILPNSLLAIGVQAFYGCSALTGIVLPNSLTTLSNQAFYNCAALSIVNIPSSVTSIGTQAFAYCTGLSKIYAYPTTPVDLSLSTTVFQNVSTTNCTLYVPTGSVTAYQAAEQWKDFTNISGIIPTGLLRTNSNEVIVYPNPVTTEFRITGIESEVAANLYDVSGKLMLSTKLNNQEGVSVKNLPNAIYILKLSTVNGPIEKKIVKL